MDPNTIDRIARLVGSGHSRRRLVKSGALGALAAAVGRGAASAHARRALGDSCTANQDCTSGRCVQDARTRKICHCARAGDCPADQCRTAVCLANGACGATIMTGAPCDDGDAATCQDVCQADGVCAGTAVDVQTDPDNCGSCGQSCNDFNVCTIDACVAGLCTHRPIINCCTQNADCDDDNLCTTNACISNRCTETLVSCNDFNVCTEDSCDPESGCVFTQITCDPGDQCNTAAACDTETGCGTVTPLTGTVCDAGGAHTGTCQSGVCVGNNCPSTDCPAFATPNGDCYWLSNGGRGTIANCYYPTGDVLFGTGDQGFCTGLNSGCGSGGGCFLWLTSSC